MGFYFGSWFNGMRKANLCAYVHRQNAVDEMRISREQRRERMQQGPFLKGGEVRIPSYIFYPRATPKANAEWKRRGLTFDGPAQEWHVAVPAQHAQAQLAKARLLFYQFFQFDHTPAHLQERREDQRSHGD